MCLSAHVSLCGIKAPMSMSGALKPEFRAQLYCTEGLRQIMGPLGTLASSSEVCVCVWKREKINLSHFFQHSSMQQTLTEHVLFLSKNL